MSEPQKASVLAVCVNEAAQACLEKGSFVTASSARQATDLLRMLRFDLVIISAHLPDMPMFAFVRRMKAAWPWQKWALLAGELTCEQEIAARSLGVLGIFDERPQRDSVLGLTQSARTGNRERFHVESRDGVAAG